MKSIVIFLTVLLFAGPLYAEPKNLYYDGGALTVYVSIAKVTEISFPQKVARIVKGGEANSVMVEVLDNSVFILPKSEVMPDIFVTSVTGENYPLHLVIADKNDIKLKVVPAFGEEARAQGKNRALDLMKIILQGRVPAQANITTSQEIISLADGMIELRLQTIIELPHLRAFLLSATNNSENTAILPLESISYPGLLAIAADTDALAGKNQPGFQTRVYMVVGQ